MNTTQPLNPMKPLLCLLAATLPLALNSQAAVPVPPVILTEQGVKNLGLETVTVEETNFETTTFALGRTEAIPEHRSILSSRIPGRVAESRLKIGTHVRKGAPLVLLESRQPGDPPPSIWLTAPADGTVTAVNTTLGAPVDPSDRLAEFADLETIYLIATLPQATAGKIREGTQANVRFPIRPQREYTATLLRPAAYLCADASCATGQDLSTRTTKGDTADLNTASVVFTIPNPDHELRPELHAECSIIMEKRTGVLSVPREAVQGGPANRHVYVKHPTIPNAFDRVNVQTGLASNDRIEIVEGLLPGDEVVTRGSYSLGFAGSGGGPSLREAMDLAHGHEHNEDGSEKSQELPQVPGHAAAVTPDHDPHTPRTREFFFMATTAIFALLLTVTSLRRRQPATATAELH